MLTSHAAKLQPQGTEPDSQPERNHSFDQQGFAVLPRHWVVEQGRPGPLYV